MPRIRLRLLFVRAILCGSAIALMPAIADAQTQAEAPKPPPSPPAPTATAPAMPENPFKNRLPAPGFEGGTAWINTAGPIELEQLRGKFVLLDFWTYCCINCMHILPELKKLEHAYANELVVIGVHSAKFDNEKDARNITEAVLRYEIEHPVVNDPDHAIWNAFGTRSWPSIALIDPEGQLVAVHSGEFTFEQIDPIFKRAVAYYKAKGTLDERPLRFDLESQKTQVTPLRFPGKILADAAGRRLFIADSNHNRIVVAGFDGKLIATIGGGAVGKHDGDFATATFNHPQGMALRGETLYVADTENHLLRKVDLAAKQVTTIAGLGVQSRNPWPGLDPTAFHTPAPARFVGKPKETGLNSPWDLWIHGADLFIAMAGPHQIWKMPLDESEIGPYAGNGREDIIDGPLLPPQPYEAGYSSFAQPSGLSSDGTWLYVADSEGSSIRAVPFDAKQAVRTVVGTAHFEEGRLFRFGDVDGDAVTARLQHALAVVHHEGRLYVADTYNNKIKVTDAKTGDTKTLSGTGKPGLVDDPPQFDEPAGLSLADGVLYVADTNNHAIRTIELKTGRVATLTIAGLAPPAKPVVRDVPVVAVSAKPAALTLMPQAGVVRVPVRIRLPSGWKINPLAPQRYQVDAAADKSGPVERTTLGTLIRLEKPAAEFEIPLAIGSATSGSATLDVAVTYYYCREGKEGVCKIGSAAWRVDLTLGNVEKPSGALEIDAE